MAGLSALQKIYLSHTPVTDLSPLAGLAALRQLDFSGTRVADLGPLAALSALQQLRLWGTTAVNGLPETLVGLPRLETLTLNAQPGLGEIPGEVVSQEWEDNCLPRLRAHLADLTAGRTPLRDLKVVVLGNGRVGKTQLCRRLRGEPFEADADSTHGISVTSVELSLPDDEAPAVLNLWDFGGQDLYHGTHALFMRTRAIFLLVWTPESEQGEQTHGGTVFRSQPLPYWLEYIRHLGGAKSPVILLQTRCDRGLGERPNLPVDDRFLIPLQADGRLVTRVAYSAKDDSGRASVMDALQWAAIQLRTMQGRPVIGRGRLAVWEQLRAWRDADAAETDPDGRGRRSLTYGDFAGLCARHGVTRPETFVEVLHHAGMVFYRPRLFEDRLILDQSWALDAIYAVFTREGAVYETLRRLGGRFTRPLLDTLLWRARGLRPDDQRSLIDMMKAGGVCFEHRRRGDPDETEYLAPDLLPEGRTGPPSALAGDLAARWDPIPGDPLTASLRYPFLSPSIGRAVLSELGRLGGDTALYWRYGLCLYDAESRASAIIETVADADEAAVPSLKPGYGGRLRLRVKGAGAERLLAALIERLQKLNQNHGWAGELEDSWTQGTSPHVRPVAVKAGDGSGLTRLTLSDPPAEPPATPEVYVSFAWKQDRAEPLVDDLIAGLAEHGIPVRRDSNQLQPGDSISSFLKRLSAGRCVLLVISEAYLRSPFCMTELQGIWVNARQREDLFRKRIVPLVQADAGIGTLVGRIAHAVHWKRQYQEVDALICQHGADVVGAEDFRRFKLIGDFYRHVSDILSFADDVLVPRDRPTLSRESFAVVRDLIARALE